VYYVSYYCLLVNRPYIVLWKIVDGSADQKIIVRILIDQ